MAEHNELGKEGEDEAAHYLTERGYHIRQRQPTDYCGSQDTAKRSVRTSRRRHYQPQDTHIDIARRFVYQEIQARPPGAFRCHYGCRQ